MAPKAAFGVTVHVQGSGKLLPAVRRQVQKKSGEKQWYFRRRTRGNPTLHDLRLRRRPRRRVCRVSRVRARSGGRAAPCRPVLTAVLQKLCNGMSCPV